ncbi:PIN domain-containing protein [Mycobacterium canetti]|uniref:PIN domain-containing protein n=1 Tax=Mycobacterium canetti TaxID=78331 RepID=UPI000695DB4C|nr:PIN domain-containing protein [Mycobacterium canetti]
MKKRGTDPFVANLPLREVHLVDTSAWSKARNDAHLLEVFDESARGGLVATCDVVCLELLRSARNRDRFMVQSRLLSTLPQCPIGRREQTRAREVQVELAAAGHHRGVKPVDLLIAAAAEAAQLPVLHYDHDYDIIAAITGQPSRWLAAPGALP